ncbi:MAG: hypothetical protein U1E05_02640, partial [Patescibacteria group bacterium]|nr:hypothetical protein [Patescibacteria group bacterium]
ATIDATYSLVPSGECLLAIYGQLATVARDRPVKPLKDSRGLATRFLTPARFRPLRIRDE